MFSKNSSTCIGVGGSGSSKALQLAVVSCFAFACLVVMTRLISAQPLANAVGLFPTINKLNGGGGSGDEGDKAPQKEDSVERSFHSFINSKPTESTVIGELKPNASEQEINSLKEKIANTIISMQERDREEKPAPGAASKVVPSRELPNGDAECYIEVTKVEKIPGKCHRASSGLPICQSENYMTISSECS